uniref:Uncharacterized protein n=1 Tax=Rhodnius prolixus TaxID=13249 RepID=T1HFR0_RHOPR
MENAIVRLQEANQKESTVNENLEQDVIELEALLEKTLEEYKKKVEQTNAVKDEIKMIENDIINSEKKQETINKCLEEKNKIIKDLQKTKETQPISCIDIKKIREKCSSLQRDIDAQVKYIQDYENQFFQEDLAIMALQKELQTKTKKCVQILEEVIDESTLEKIKIPESIQDLEIENIKNACLVLQEFKDKSKADSKDFTNQDNKAIIEKLNAENDRLQSELDCLEEKHNLLKEEINKLLNEHKKKMVELNKDLAAIEDKLSEIAKNVPENLEDLARRQSILADEMEAELQEFRRRAANLISERFKKFKEHKQEINVNIQFFKIKIPD